MTTNWTDSQKKLIKTVASAMEVDDVLTVSRQQRYIDSRMMLFKYLKDIGGWNCTEISRMTGMGASAISNSIESFDSKIKYDQRLEDVWNYVKQENCIELLSDNEDNLKAIAVLEKLRDRSKVEMALSKFNMIIAGINGL